MREMIDRVATAIVERQRELWADKSGKLYVEPLELARAAIEAMRVPTSKMVNAGVCEAGSYDVRPLELRATYAAMIDAALTSSAPPDPATAPP